MPMVPTFQGNIPRVRDTGGSGMVSAQPVTPRTDYAAVMREAMKPINDTANAVSEALKINHARTVKAESDDAENMVIQTINTYMNDPENGYMTKQGKNAMDGFQPTVEKMQADIQKIVGQLQPATRQAIESRINDRMMSAIGQAQRWNTQQTQKYHIDSSKARVETLLDDGANHYADPNYLAKTWGSIEAELEYQTADFGGVPPEVAKQMKDQTFALFQSKRFAAWAQDDPVMAFAAFRNEKKNIDPDIAQKIENSLFGQSRDLLAYELAMKPITYEGADTFEPKDFTNEYNTKLSAEEEKEFQKWAKEQGRERDLFDYDLRGAWKEMQSGAMQEDDRGHLGDKYKKPNHPTFSNQSIYSNDQNVGGKWEERGGQTIFTPGRKLSKAEADFLQRYFAEVEPGVVLNASVQDNAKTWMDDPRAKTGDAFIDSLPPDQHLSVVAKAMSLRRSMTSELKNTVKLETANSLARVLTTGNDDNPLTLGQFVEVYGPKEGQKNYDQYMMDFDYNQTMYDFKRTSNEDMRKILKSQKPSPQSDNYAQEYKYWEGKVKAAAEIQKQRAADPVGYAIENELYGYQPLNFSSNAELENQLKLRAANINNLKNEWGVPDSIMSKAEATQLVGVLEQADIDTKLDLLRRISNSTGSDGIRALSEQLKSGNVKYAMAVSGMEDYDQSGTVSVGEMYLRGKDAIEQKRVKVDTAAMYGLEASIYNTLGDEEGAEAVFTSPQAMSATAELVKGVYGYQALNGGNAQDALEQSVGVIYNHNGKKIVLPKNVRGFTLMGDDFDDLVIKKADEIRKGKKNFYAAGYSLTPAEFADLLPQMKLQTYSRQGDSMLYQVLFNGDAVRGPDGEVFLLSIGGEQ